MTDRPLDELPDFSAEACSTKYSLALLDIIDQQTTLIRKLEKEHKALGRKNQQDLEEMTRLNNSLSTSQRQLVKQKIKLDRLNQQLNEILGMTAHDIRNSLLRIQGFSKLSSDADFNASEQQEANRRIEQSSNEALFLLNDILDVSKIESGQLQLKQEPVDLVAMLKDSAIQNSVLASHKQQKILFASHLERCVTLVDGPRLQQVINNFLSNAIKFSPLGGSIELGLSIVMQAAEIWVQDHGTGMDSEHLEALRTGAKVQGQQGTMGEKSNGLGLAISKRVVVAHGGVFKIESELGVGSRFIVRLPLDPQSLDIVTRQDYHLDQVQRLEIEAPQKLDGVVPQNRTLAQALEPSAEVQEARTLGKVLIVDDQFLNLSLLKMTLKKWVSSIEAFTNPLEALEKVFDGDLVISDQEMPQMKGADFLIELRRRGFLKTTVLLTAHELSQEQIELLKGQGIDFVLTKPFRRDDFLRLFPNLS